jgi:hypothetical protein
MIRDFSDPGYNHGTLGGYKKGCRCHECRRARADNDLRLRGVTEPKFRFLKGVPLDHPDYPHGTLRGYRYCKCGKCRAANAAHKAPHNDRQRQSDDFRARQRELNRAYKDTEAGRAKRRAHHAARKAVMRGARCTEADKRLMERIYKACPQGYQVDHCTPLARGGKHLPDNLQYLPASVNNAKRTKLDFDCAAHAIKWQDLVEPSTTIPQGSRAKRPEVPRAL